MDSEQLPSQDCRRKNYATRKVLPLYQRGNRLFVGLSDPTSRAALDELKFQSGLLIEPVVVEDSKLGRIIARIVQDDRQ